MKLKKQYTGIKQYKIVFTAIALFFAVSDLCAQSHGSYPDYLTETLQKMPKFKGFEGQDSIPHYFFEIYSGPTFSIVPGKEGTQNPGLELGIAVGHWFTPIHGARFGLFGKYYNSYPLGEKVKSNDLGVSLDYLMNFSALAKDFSAIRRFELLGIAGGEYLLSQHTGVNYGTWGVRAGIQARYALSYGNVLFIEPRIGLYSDNLDYTDNWRNYNIAGSIVGGVEFRTPPRNKRLINEFNSSTFKDHSFLISGVGIGSLVAKGGSGLSNYVGGSAFAGVGRWLSPFSGVRLLGKAAIFKYPATKSKISSVGAQADYLLNLNNVFYGYTPDRAFELIAVGGASYDFVKNQENTNVLGLGAGLQASIKLSRDINFFFEPRINFYPDKYYAIGPNGEDKTRVNFLINTGFQLTSNPSRAASPQESSADNSFLDNTFFGIAFGLNSPIRQASFYKNDVDPRMAGYIGKWFTNTSGVRLSADIGKLWESRKKPSAKIATIGVDYLWNITSFMNGYDPDRTFELIGAAGANIAFRSSTFNHRSYLGGELSLQGLWNVTPSFGLFIEPQLRIYPNEFSEGSIHMAKLDGVAAVMAGVNIRLKDVSREQKRLFLKEEKNHTFFSFSAGTNLLATHIRHDNAYGISGQMAFGKWYTPVSAWRIGLNGEYRQENRIKYLYGGAEADYMVSISNILFGYDPDRRLDLNAFTGVNLGMDYERKKVGFAPGLSAGGQVVFKATPNLDLFVEPKATLRRTFRTNPRNEVMPMANLQIGLNYTLSPNKISHSQDFATDDHSSYFISANLGIGAYSGSFASGSSKNPFGYYGIAVGKRMTPVSYVRIGLGRKEFDNARKEDINVTTISADYLPNLSTLAGGYDQDRKFEILGVIGANMNFASKKGADSTTPLGFKLGMQTKFNLSKKLDFTLEPTFNLYNKSLDKSDSRRYKATGEFTVGINYKL